MITRVIFLFFIMISYSCDFNKNEEKIDEYDPTTSFEVIWNSEKVNIDGNEKSIIIDSFLYFPEAYSGGLSSISLSTGKLVWQKKNIIRPESNIASFADYVFILSSRINVGVICLDKNTGGIYKIIKPDILNYDNVETRTIFSGSEIIIHNSYLYFTLTSNFYKDGWYRISINDLNFDENNIIFKKSELVLEKPNDKTRITNFPIFTENKIYFYVGGQGDRYNSDYPEMTYKQEDIKVICMDFNKNVIWETGFRNIGSNYGASEVIKLVEDYLYIADGSGRAKIDKKTGEVIYDVPVENFTGVLDVEFLTISDNLMFSNYHNHIKAADLATGKQVWEFDTKYYNCTNPIVYGDLVYNVDAEALRAFDKKNGQLIYEDKSLGIDGARIVGYIPHQDDMIYIMDTNVIKAVRLKEAP